MASRCWAYGPFGRCEKDGGHDDNHQIVQEWGDDDCVDFAGAQGVSWAEVMFAPSAPTLEPPDDDSIQILNGRCFSCGCTEAQHLEATEDFLACEAHQCRTFVP